MRKIRRTVACVLALLSLFVPSAAAQQMRPGDETGVLVLGRISDNPKEHYEQLKPLLDYLVPRMGDVGVRSGRILMARDLQQMTSYLRRGRVDLINETAGNASLLEERGVASSFLIAERDRAAHYHSIFFVRKDSPIQSMRDLTGHSLAFQSPYSTTAYYVPAAVLLDSGHSLEPLLSPMDAPSPDRVGYLFARTELNISTWVEKRLVDVGVVSNIDWDNPRRVLPEFLPELRIIGRSDDIPRSLMMVRSGLDSRVEGRLRELLLEAANDPRAATALRQFMETSRFVPISADDRAVMRRLGRGVQRVLREVE